MATNGCDFVTPSKYVCCEQVRAAAAAAAAAAVVHN